MPTDQIILLAILAISTLLYVTQWLPIELTSVLIIVALMATGVLNTSEALSGFSSSATITVGAMFVISAGLVRTGALENATAMIVRGSRGNPWRMLLLIAIIVPLISAFMNNTPVVVMMIPVVLSLSKRFGVFPSKFLLPVAYLATLGGTISLLGTSTNILVDGMYRASGGPGIGLFEFTKFGLIYAGVGVIYVMLFANRILPDRAPLASLAARKDSAVYITELTVEATNSAVGKLVPDLFRFIADPGRAMPPAPAQRRHRRISKPPATEPARIANSVELLELVREGEVFRAQETNNLRLAPNDTLLVSGTPKEIAAFMKSAGMPLATVLDDGEREPQRDVEQEVIEAVVLPQSSVIGRLVADLRLYALYGVSVMGVQRLGRQQFRGLRGMRLNSGDVLLLRGSRQGLAAATESNRLLVVEGVDETIIRTGRNWQALLILLGVVLLGSFTEIPIVSLALAGAALMVITGCLRPGEAIRSLDASSLLLLAGTIPLGAAMEATGLAQTVVDWLLNTVGTANPLLFLSMFFLMTWILTELLSNNAVAVLVTPIALSLAQSTGMNPTALLRVVIFGASCSFVMPQGYQTNAIVMGPGGYRFIDYVKFGLPLSLLCWLAATIFIPIFWPLY
ncbi:MAG: SLC13 family permease [Anaerolineales bacterium]|nr:SLC13 family permease [Anaerolineales bacterium]